MCKIKQKLIDKNRGNSRKNTFTMWIRNKSILRNSINNLLYIAMNLDFKIN